MPRRKGCGIGVPMGFCCPNCGVGVPKCLHLGWGPYGGLMPHRKGCGVGGPYGVCCPIGRDLESGFLWGFVDTAKGFGVGVTGGV